MSASKRNDKRPSLAIPTDHVEQDDDSVCLFRKHYDLGLEIAQGYHDLNARADSMSDDEYSDALNRLELFELEQYRIAYHISFGWSDNDFDNAFNYGDPDVLSKVVGRYVDMCREAGGPASGPTYH